MFLVRPGLFTILACASLATCVLASPPGGNARELPAVASPTSDASDEPASPVPAVTVEATTPSPTPRRAPVARKTTPWPFGIHSPKPAEKRHATPAPVPTIRRATQERRAAPQVASPSPSPGALVPAEPEATPSASPSPSPTASAQRRRRDSRPAVSPSPAATDTPSAQPSVSAGPETPIPTQPPTPRPLAPNQPTIPDSMADPNVRGIIARPIRQLSQIGWMQGTWAVTGVSNREDGTTVPVPPTTYVFSPIMNGRWMFGADGRASDYIYLTFDPFTRRWVALRFGNNPSYGMWQSQKGWVGNRIDFVTNFSYVNGRQYRRRLTIIHKDARTFGIYELEEQADGSFIPDDAYEFKKTS